MLLLMSAAAARARMPQPSGPQQEVKHTFDKTVPLPSGQSLRIEHRLGSITVRTHSSSDVHVSANIRVAASSQEDAENFANQIQIRLESSTAGVLVRTEYPEQNNSFWNRRNISFQSTMKLKCRKARH